MRSFAVPILLLVLALGALPATAQAPVYHVRDIGSLYGYSTFAAALNEHGQVVGHSGSSIPFGPPYHAFVYSGGVMTDLHPSSLAWSSDATDINDSGLVVGYERLESMGSDRPFRWLAGEGPLYLNPFEEDEFSYRGEALGVNDAGQIVGWAVDSDLPGGQKAFLLPTGVSTVSPLMPPLSSAVAVSDVEDPSQAPIVVGTRRESGFMPESGFAYRDGENGEEVDDLDAILPYGERFEPSAVNDAGQILGTARGSDGYVEATVILYDYLSYAKLGFLDGKRSFGNGINSRGDVVGLLHPIDSNDPWRAFLWLDGEMYDLNDLLPDGAGVFLLEGRDINDKGQIVAVGHRVPDDGIRRSYLLTPADPVTAIEELTVFIEGLELPDGLENALLVKLQNALAALEAGVASEACDLLGAFVNQVEAQTGKAISEPEATEAIEQATAAREALGCL
jgi:probable HAF family extracellular repeat protein